MMSSALTPGQRADHIDHYGNVLRAMPHVAGEIDHRLARRHHAGRPAHLAIEESRALGTQERNVTLLVRHRMRAELDHDLTGPRRSDQPVRALHYLVERLRRWQAGEHD